MVSQSGRRTTTAHKPTSLILGTIWAHPKGRIAYRSAGRKQKCSTLSSQLPSRSPLSSWHQLPPPRLYAVGLQFEVSNALLSHGPPALSPCCPALCCSLAKPLRIPEHTFTELGTGPSAGPKICSQLSFFHDVIQALLSIWNGLLLLPTIKVQLDPSFKVYLQSHLLVRVFSGISNYICICPPCPRFFTCYFLVAQNSVPLNSD